MAESLMTRLGTSYNYCTMGICAEFVDNNNRTLNINYVYCIYILRN